jgi:hypothetical protein
MTLNVTSGEIQIKNASGQVKFNANNKLIWQKLYQTGTVTITGGKTIVSVANNPNGMGANEFSLISVTMTSATGDSRLVNTFLNKEIKADGSFIVDFYGRNSSNNAAADTEQLSIAYIGTNLIFNKIRFYDDGQFFDGTTTITLNYKLRVWSYA